MIPKTDEHKSAWIPTPEAKRPATLGSPVFMNDLMNFVTRVRLW